MTIHLTVEDGEVGKILDPKKLIGTPNLAISKRMFSGQFPPSARDINDSRSDCADVVFCISNHFLET